MPKTPFDAFSKQIKSGDIPSSIYFYGDEDVLKDEAVRAIVDRTVEAGVRDFNYDVRSAAQLDPDVVESLCNTLPMMADRRVVVIREVESWNKRARAKSAVLHYLEKPAAETVLILVQGASRREDDRGDGSDADLVRVTCAVDVDRLTPKRAEKWVLTRAAENGVIFEPGAAEHLIKAVEYDLGAARSELDKLTGLGGSTPVTLAQIAALMGVRHGETPADWCDAVLNDRPGPAAAMLSHLLELPGVTGVSLLTQLGTQLICFGIARAHYDRGARGSGLEGAIFQSLIRARPAKLDYRERAAFWGRLVEQWPISRVEAAISAARAADVRLKGTKLADERGVLIDLIMQLAHRAREAA